MAWKPRIQYTGTFYHVIGRGNGAKKIFRDDQDYERQALRNVSRISVEI